jgi:hypothetical protein
MKTKILACIAIAVVMTGCEREKYMSPMDCDIVIREKYTNCSITRLTIPEQEPDRDSYHPKWLVKTPENNIIFIQRYNDELIEQNIF